jgi:hypothetical protein
MTQNITSDEAPRVVQEKPGPAPAQQAATPEHRASVAIVRLKHDVGDELRQPVTVSGATVAAAAVVTAAFVTGVAETALAAAAAYLVYRTRKRDHSRRPA